MWCYFAATRPKLFSRPTYFRTMTSYISGDVWNREIFPLPGTKSRQELAQIIRNKTPKKDYLVVDVREDDWAGGNIVGGEYQNTLSSTPYFFLNVRTFLKVSISWWRTLRMFRLLYFTVHYHKWGECIVLKGRTGCWYWTKGPKAARVCSISQSSCRLLTQNSTDIQRNTT